MKTEYVHFKNYLDKQYLLQIKPNQSNQFIHGLTGLRSVISSKNLIEHSSIPILNTNYTNPTIKNLIKSCTCTPKNAKLVKNNKKFKKANMFITSIYNNNEIPNQIGENHEQKFRHYIMRINTPLPTVSVQLKQGKQNISSRYNTSTNSWKNKIKNDEENDKSSKLSYSRMLGQGLIYKNRISQNKKQLKL